MMRGCTLCLLVPLVFMTTSSSTLRFVQVANGSAEHAVFSYGRGTEPEEGTYVVEERNHHYGDAIDQESGAKLHSFRHPLPQREREDGDGAKEPLFYIHNTHHHAPPDQDHLKQQQKHFYRHRHGGEDASQASRGNGHKAVSDGSSFFSADHHSSRASLESGARGEAPRHILHADGGHNLHKIEDTYITEHGHRMRKLPEHNCHDPVLKACFPHKRGANFQQHVQLSVLAKCLTSKQIVHHLPSADLKRCQHFIHHLDDCAEDIEALCPMKNHEATFDCIDENWSKISPKCRSSDWYLHNFQHDYARQTKARYHEDDDYHEEMGSTRRHLKPFTTPLDMHSPAAEEEEEDSSQKARTRTHDGEEYFGEL